MQNPPIDPAYYWSCNCKIQVAKFPVIFSKELCSKCKSYKVK